MAPPTAVDVRRSRSTSVPASGPSTITGKLLLVLAVFPDTLQLLLVASVMPFDGPVKAATTICVTPDAPETPIETSVAATNTQATAAPSDPRPTRVEAKLRKPTRVFGAGE